MKKFLKLAAIACAAALFVSCGAKDDKSQIKDVMESYVKASISMDYAKLKSLATPETQPMYDQAAEMMKNLPEEAKNAMLEASKLATFNAESIVINGETATAKISYGATETPVYLQKVNGKWLVGHAAGGSTAGQEQISADDEESADEEGDVVEEEEEEVEEEEVVE